MAASSERRTQSQILQQSGHVKAPLRMRLSSRRQRLFLTDRSSYYSKQISLDVKPPTLVTSGTATTETDDLTRSLSSIVPNRMVTRERNLWTYVDSTVQVGIKPKVEPGSGTESGTTSKPELELSTVSESKPQRKRLAVGVD
ncbi:hypothetical protein EVAR_63463_1 [Eumeta japonica]|uniref:Uncharacterized protein n=1 Tax=Eumeta variegata TaxID=151549 RepID=A0A4C1YDH7_EUMVA|nr:hypothetical protein EVAR_63463_1 [Eumeta japonica]